MLDVVMTHDRIIGLTKGRLYRILYVNRNINTAFIENDNKDRVGVIIDEDCVVMNKGLPTVDNPDFREMLWSLGESIDLAGGDPRTIVNSLAKTSALDLMKSLAPNGVRFSYELSHENREQLKRRKHAGEAPASPFPYNM